MLYNLYRRKEGNLQNKKRSSPATNKKLQLSGRDLYSELGGFHNKQENNCSYPASHAVNTYNDQLLTWVIIKVDVANAKQLA